MNDLYYNIIIIVLVLILFLAYILIAYFYSSYSNYKEDVDDNFEKTKNYINLNISKLDNNIRSSINENNTRIKNTSNTINDLNTKITRVDLKGKDNYDEVKNSINTTNTNLLNYNNKLTSNELNLKQFDNNLKQFFQYKTNGTTINQSIYEYQFGVSPNLSLDFLRNINAVSGMSVNTNNTTNNNFRLCDNNLTKNCMDLNIDNNGLNIFPSSINTNSTSNIYIYDKNKTKILAKFDLDKKGIYLGGDGENAGLYIQESNVYVKNLNLLSPTINYSNENKLLYDKTKKGQIQTFNIYPYEFNDINTTTLITGIYQITRGVESPPLNTIIINFKSSNDIPAGTIITFNIPELSNTSTIDKSISTFETFPSGISTSIILNTKNIRMINTGTILKNINIRIKATSEDLMIIDSYNETLITNIINMNI